MSLPELPENIPAELSHIITHCLEKNQEKRFQTARDLVFDLKRIDSHSVGRLSVPAAQVAGRDARATRVKRFSTIVAAAVIGLIAIAALIVALRKQHPSPQETAAPKIQSLAVLPLKNLSGDPKQEYFSDGMTEELITRLGKIESLRVISRTSVMEYKGAHKKIPEIAKELNVDAVVEGSVLQAGDRVRITAQLIHAASDRQMWSESYERDLRDILGLQNEVARSIADEIRIKLTPEEKTELAKKPQVHPEAYNAYLRGLELWNWGFAKPEELKLSVEMFERALELDPNFALAYAQLSTTYSDINYADRTPQGLAAAKEAADNAFRLQPDMPEAHMALGWYYFYGFNNYDVALKEFTIARKSLPNDPHVMRGVAEIRGRQGDFQGFIRDFKTLLDLSPRDVSICIEIGRYYAILRRYAEAEEYYNRAISLHPDLSAAYRYKAWNYVLWKGDIRKAKLILENLPQKDAAIWFGFNVTFRNFEEALKQVSSISAEELQSDSGVPKDQHMGEIYRFMNQPEPARRSFHAARVEWEKRLKELPDDWYIHANLGITYAGLGLKDAAIREGKLAVELLPASKDALEGPSNVENLAQIYVMIGEYDAALEQIEYLLSIPSWFSVPYLRVHPIWDPLRSHPRFQKVLEKYDHGDTEARS